MRVLCYCFRAYAIQKVAFLDQRISRDLSCPTARAHPLCLKRPFDWVEEAKGV